MKQSPCNECDLHAQGASKSSEKCTMCEKRIEYANSISHEAGYGVEIDEHGKSEKRRRCYDCKKYLPETEEYFQRHYSGKLLAVCKECQNIRIENGRIKAKEKKALKDHPSQKVEPKIDKQQEKVADKADVVKHAPKVALNEFTLQIDFSQHRDEFDKLRLWACDEIRSTEGQALYLLLKLIRKDIMN